MTPPTLPTTLTRLAELLPERVRIDPHREASYAEVRVRGEWQYVYCITPDSPAWASHGLGEMWLEAALREEIESRGWYWMTERCDWPSGDYRASISATGTWAYVGYAPTPAHAIALALLAALEGAQ